VRVSRRTLGAIARALRLDATERAHLLQLAAAAAAPTPPSPTGTATPSLRALVDALAPHPAYAVNARWDVLHANAPAVATFGDFAARPGVTDNVLARLLLDEGWRTCFVDWGAVTASAIAQFRAATGRMVGDAWWKAFVARLSAESAVFREAWARHDLAAAASWEKTVRHADGTVTPYRYASLAPDAEAPDVRIVVYAAVVRA
jgi:hypothetical protein